MPRPQVGGTIHRRLIESAIKQNAEVAGALAEMLAARQVSREELAVRIGRAALSLRSQYATLVQMQELINGKDMPAAEGGGQGTE